MDGQNIWDSTNIEFFPMTQSVGAPVIANLTYQGKRYMCFTGPHGGWFEIDDTVTLEMVMSRWERYTSPETKEKEKLAEQGTKEFQIKGSKGNEYTVTLRGGEWSCTCVGFGFRRKCKHIEKAKQLV